MRIQYINILNSRIAHREENMLSAVGSAARTVMLSALLSLSIAGCGGACRGEDSIAAPSSALSGSAPALPARNASATPVLAPTETLDLDGLLLLAERVNPTLAAAKRDREASRGRIRQAGLYPNPALEISEEEVPADPFDESRGKISLQAIQPVIVGERRRAALGLEHAEQQLRERLVEMTRHRVYLDVHQDYLDFVYAGEGLSLRIELIGLAEDIADRAEEKSRAARDTSSEESARLDADRARLEAESSRRELLTWVTQRAVARERLRGRLGGIALAPEQITGKLEPRLDFTELAFSVESALDNHPEIPVAIARETLVERQMELARAQRIPDITLRAGAAYDRDRNQTTLQAGVMIPIPAFDRNQGTLRELSDLREKARLERDETRNRLAAQLANLMQMLNEYDTLLTDTRGQLIPAAQSVYEAAARRHADGSIALLDLLDAQRAWFRLRKDALAYQYEINRLLAELRHFRGYAPLPVDSSSPPNPPDSGRRE